MAKITIEATESEFSQIMDEIVKCCAKCNNCLTLGGACGECPVKCEIRHVIKEG
jgi:hypothetical protein